jgi:hypothetical protein
MPKRTARILTSRPLAGHALNNSQQCLINSVHLLRFYAYVKDISNTIDPVGVSGSDFTYRNEQALDIISSRLTKQWRLKSFQIC